MYKADRIDVTFMRQSYSATNWQQEVVSFSKCFEFTILLLPNLLQTSSEYCKNTADVKLWREYWYLKYCCHGNASNLNILFFWWFEAIRAFFGGLNMVKNSWKCAHTLETPAAVWTPLRLGPRAWHRGSTAPPRTHQENLMCSSHYLHVLIWNSVHI